MADCFRATHWMPAEFIDGIALTCQHSTINGIVWLATVDVPVLYQNWPSNGCPLQGRSLNTSKGPLVALYWSVRVLVDYQSLYFLTIAGPVTEYQHRLINGIVMTCQSGFSSLIHSRNGPLMVEHYWATYRIPLKFNWQHSLIPTLAQWLLTIASIAGSVMEYQQRFLYGIVLLFQTWLASLMPTLEWPIIGPVMIFHLLWNFFSLAFKVIKFPPLHENNATQYI